MELNEKDDIKDHVPHGKLHWIGEGFLNRRAVEQTYNEEYCNCFNALQLPSQPIPGPD